MKNTYIDGMKEIKADEDLRNKIIRSIDPSYSEVNSSSGTRSPFNTSKKVISIFAVACTLALFAVFGLPYVQPNEGSTQSSTVQSLFSGFMISVYAADGTRAEVRPNVTFPLGTYSMMMSSVPGFPINIVSTEADSIVLQVTDGNLLSWTPPAPQVITLGQEATIQSGGTIYWTPATDNLHGISTTSTIKIIAYQDHSEIGRSTIHIQSDGMYQYSGILQK